jgi:hypothetical protein
VVCINDLEPARAEHEFALTLARNVWPDADAVLPIEDSFLAYESIGDRSYRGERRWSSTGREKHATSLDPLIAVQLVEGSVQLLVNEWKYTPSYPTGESLATSRRCTSRVEIRAIGRGGRTWVEVHGPSQPPRALLEPSRRK